MAHASSAPDLAALYERHAETLLVFFVRRTFDPDTAADLFAETFAQATASKHRFKGGEEDLDAWLYKLAYRQLSRYYRRGAVEKRGRTRIALERSELGEEASAALMRRAGLAELRTDLARALATLPDDTRRAVQLRIVDELPFSEVARHLNTSEQNARTRVSRGLRALGELIDPTVVTEVAQA